MSAELILSLATLLIAPLCSAEVHVIDVMDDNGQKVLGEYISGHIYIDKDIPRYEIVPTSLHEAFHCIWEKKSGEEKERIKRRLSKRTPTYSTDPEEEYAELSALRLASSLYE